MGILIEKDGERQWVNSLDGYPTEGPGAWTVVLDGCPRPVDHATLVNGEWVVDEVAKAAADEAARLATMPRHELVAEIRAEQGARIAALEGQLSQLQAAIGTPPEELA